jgi:ribosome-binding protein aMBF1 (putative translation factor)
MDAIGWRVSQSKNAPSCGVPTGRKRRGDEEMLTRLGVNVERERKARGFTQEKFAELVDLHPRVIQKIESGETNLKVTTFFRLQAVLGCEWERLVPPVKL